MQRSDVCALHSERSDLDNLDGNSCSLPVHPCAYLSASIRQNQYYTMSSPGRRSSPRRTSPTRANGTAGQINANHNTARIDTAAQGRTTPPGRQTPARPDLVRAAYSIMWSLAHAAFSCAWINSIRSTVRELLQIEVRTASDRRQRTEDRSQEGDQAGQLELRHSCAYCCRSASSVFAYRGYLYHCIYTRKQI